jgi:hypothetical protein
LHPFSNRKSISLLRKVIVLRSQPEVAPPRKVPIAQHIAGSRGIIGKLLHAEAARD